MSESPSKPFDVIIVGGGQAGGLAALALADAGFSCAVIDALDPATMRAAPFDGRTTALAYASARVFQKLSLWPHMSPYAEPIRDILVTDGKRDSSIRKGHVSPFHLHFDSRELGDDDPLGWIVENRLLRDVLFEKIRTTNNIKLFAPAKRLKTVYGKGAATVILETGEELTASLVVAADGRFSASRAEAGIKTNRWSYDQCGIVATVAHERSHKGVAQELFLASGPFAILPMTPLKDRGRIVHHRSSLVWTETKDATPAYLALEDEAFLRQIRNRFGDYLGDVSLTGPRWSYPLAFHLAQSYIAPRLALIGDAAHAIHPIAGQGFNLGVKDIAALTDTVIKTREVGLDIGHLAGLERYQQWRRFDSAMLAFGTDALNRLFSNDIGPLRLARTIGMGAVNQIGPLRKFFMRQAGADAGRLPPLMQA